MTLAITQRDDTVPDETGIGGSSEHSGALFRRLTILDALLGAAKPLNLGEVAGATELDQSTAYRSLKALEENRIVVGNDATRRYSPSAKFFLPLPLLHRLDQLRRECSPVLAEVAHKHRKTVALVLFIGWQRLVMDIAQTPASLTPYFGKPKRAAKFLLYQAPSLEATSRLCGR